LRFIWHPKFKKGGKLTKKWKDYFTDEISNWLLEEANPSVRYFTLTELLDKQEKEIDVKEAKKTIMLNDPVKKILSKQNPDGSFLTQKMAQKSQALDPKNGYQPKYKGTIWQTIFLVQLGADPKDPRIKKLCEYILNTNYYPEIEVIGVNFMHSERGITTFPCYAGNMVWALSKLGFYKDYRVKNTIKWLLKYQRFDDGDFKTPDTWPYRGRKDRCFGKHTCYVGCTQALQAMTVIPKKDRNKEVNDFIEKAIDFVLLHKLYKKSRGKERLIKKEYEFLMFPAYYYDDVLEILNSLIFFKVRDKSMDSAIKFVLDKRQPSGKWLLERTIQPSSMLAKFEEKGSESKWITFRVLSMLKKYNEM
jgi:hypothetical protein